MSPKVIAGLGLLVIAIGFAVGMSNDPMYHSNGHNLAIFGLALVVLSRKSW